MQENSTKIHVENFKSLKDLHIEFHKFNVLIGPNGSGKTNVLELFKFANLCINPTMIPAYPFAPWWGFHNIVWSHDEELPIMLDVEYTVSGHAVNYQTVIASLNSNKLNFMHERLRIENYVDINRDLDSVSYRVNDAFLKKNKSSIDRLLSAREISSTQFNDFVSGYILHIDDDVSILKQHRWRMRMFNKANLAMLLTYTYGDYDDRIIALPSPVVDDENVPRSYPLYMAAVNFFTASSHIVLLRQLDYSTLRQPKPTNHPAKLQENGEGLINIMFQWYSEHNNKLPEIFELALESLFPGWQINFKVKDDGRIYINVFDGYTQLAATSIPDGFFKLLTILVAIQLNPRFLLIDEIETSLHAKIIEYIISSLKTCDSNVILTTHSPVVIDLVDLDDLITIEKAGYESVCNRVENPEELKATLLSKGITVSESWLYGEL